MPLPFGYVFTLSADCKRQMNKKHILGGGGRRQLPLTGALAATLAGSLAGTPIGALTDTLVGAIGLQYNWAVSI